MGHESKPCNVFLTFTDESGKEYTIKVDSIEEITLGQGDDTETLTIGDQEEYSFTIKPPQWWQFWKWPALYRYKKFRRDFKTLLYTGQVVAYPSDTIIEGCNGVARMYKGNGE